MKQVAYKVHGGDVMIFCPGCQCGHRFHVVTKAESGASWTWNNDLEKPTFKPSMLVKWTRNGKPQVCHSFVTEGQIQFLLDCTHDLKGKTVALPLF